MSLSSAVPVLPVLDVAAAVAFYCERLGFEEAFADGGYAVLGRDDVFIHLWAANKPDTPGAEPHLAGSASCRVMTDGVDDLFVEMQGSGVVHPNGPLTDHPWGREFTVLDLDGNALTFCEN